MLTKESFTRDEWNHLFRLLSIMNFSMFSCSHFLSNRKQSVMFKKAQESTSIEESRPMNLVSRNLLRAKKDPPQDSTDQSCISSRDRKLTRNINHPTMYSQERQQDDTQSSSTRKLGRRDESSSSARARKLERSEDIQFGRRSYISTTCRSPIIGASRKFSRTCGKTSNSQKTDQLLVSKR